MIIHVAMTAMIGMVETPPVVPEPTLAYTYQPNKQTSSHSRPSTGPAEGDNSMTTTTSSYAVHIVADNKNNCYSIPNTDRSDIEKKSDTQLRADIGDITKTKKGVIRLGL